MEAKFALLLWAFGAITLPYLTSEKRAEAAPSSGDCCGSCEYCKEAGRVYQIGQTWISNVRPCFEVKCVRGYRGAVEMRYMPRKCPKLPCYCARNSTVCDESGCCKKCNVKPGTCAPHILREQQTVQYFFLSDPEHGFCSNTEVIPGLTECRGLCRSRAVYDPVTSNFTTMCSCCTITKSEPKKVTLTCEKNKTTHRIQKDYQNPTACDCTHCGDWKPSPTIVLPIPL